MEDFVPSGYIKKMGENSYCVVVRRNTDSNSGRVLRTITVLPGSRKDAEKCLAEQLQRLNMQTTEVLIITPGNVEHRLQQDFNVRYTIKDDQIAQYQQYTDAMDHYKFRYASWINEPKEAMQAFVKRIKLRWPNISYSVYLEPDSPEAIFFKKIDKRGITYSDDGDVGIDDLMAELDRNGIPSTPMQMDYDDDYTDRIWDRLSIRDRYLESLELITSVPRVLYRAGNLVLPNTDIWLIENEQEIFKYLARRPEKIFDISPREFEKLVASVFRANGFYVELTPATRDGGFDVLAVQHSKLVGDTRFLIECKRYKPANKVGIGLVQRLSGTVNQYKATRGILVTTSSFTRSAIDCVKSTGNVVALKDYESISTWLRELNNQNDSQTHH